MDNVVGLAHPLFSHGFFLFLIVSKFGARNVAMGPAIHHADYFKLEPSYSFSAFPFAKLHSQADSLVMGYKEFANFHFFIFLCQLSPCVNVFT